MYTILKGLLLHQVRLCYYTCSTIHSAHVLSCFWHSLPRVYVINKEICMRTVCQQDEYLKGETVYMHNKHWDVWVHDHWWRNLSFYITAELCREMSGWPRRIERSSNRKRCRSRRSNPKTWANKLWWVQGWRCDHMWGRSTSETTRGIVINPLFSTWGSLSYTCWVISTFMY